jgi:hypothetical protein
MDNTSSTISDSTWSGSSSTFQTYKITYYDPVESYVPEPAEFKTSKKVKKTTVDPLDWLNERVAEITELVEL